LEEKRKILFVASIEKHILRFHIPSLKFFYDLGYEVHVACNGKLEIPYATKVHQIDFVRTPFSLKHFHPFIQLSSLFKEVDFELVHCHTAVASIITRIVAQPYRKKRGLKVLYTAHGFHFFKGAPYYYWWLFYPVERFFSRFLDCLITINDEDYQLASKKFHCKDVRRISGMGVDSSRFVKLSVVERERVRIALNLDIKGRIIVYVAEFIYRKNHAFLINAADNLKRLIPDLVILLPGRGVLLEEMKALAKQKGVEDFVYFLGFRNDVNEVLGASDLAVSTSRQEGLGLHLVEAMMCGLPGVASQDRGHREIIDHGVNGYLYEQGDMSGFCNYINLLLTDKTLYESMAVNAQHNAMRFELVKSMGELGNIYRTYLAKLESA
jgi:glycosyltransferase EpsD